MKKSLITLFSLFFCLMSLQTVAQTRYVDEVFDDGDITIVPGVEYSQNMSILAKLFIPGVDVPVLEKLKADIYMPDASVDSAIDRPVIVLPGGDDFLPRYTQVCYGTKDDLYHTTLAKKLAKLGYVVFVPTMRQGWNPLVTTPNDFLRELADAVIRQTIDVRTLARFIRKDVATGGNTYNIDPEKMLLWGTGPGVATVAVNAAFASDDTEFQTPSYIVQDENGDLVNVYDPVLFGDLYGTTEGMDPDGNVSNVANHVGYSSEYAMAVTAGGVNLDTFIVQAGEIPMIHFYASESEGIDLEAGPLNLPATGNYCCQVYFAQTYQKQSDQLGNLDAWKGIEFTNPIANTRTIYPSDPNAGIIEGAYPIVGDPGNTLPWFYWNEAECEAISPAVAANTAARRPGASMENMLSIMDEMIAYSMPRACITLGLGCNGIYVGQEEIDPIIPGGGGTGGDGGGTGDDTGGDTGGGDTGDTGGGDTGDTGGGDTGDTGGGDMEPAGNMWEVIVAHPNLNILESLTTNTTFPQLVSGDGPLTMFAPTDAAILAIPPAIQGAILADPAASAALITYHLLPGMYLSTDLEDGESYITVQGESVNITHADGNIYVNGIQIVMADILTSNGVIHTIDVVLMPPTPDTGGGDTGGTDGGDTGDTDGGDTGDTDGGDTGDTDGGDTGDTDGGDTGDTDGGDTGDTGDTDGGDTGDTDGGDTSSDTAIFADYAWLSNVIDQASCDGSVLVYKSGGYVYLYVQSGGSSVLYNASGALYCTGGANYNCLDFYTVDEELETWNCGGSTDGGDTDGGDTDGGDTGGGDTGGGSTDSPIFTDYAWLSTVVDQANCAGTSIQVYRSSGYVYVYVESPTSSILYNASGSLYCTGGANYNCLDFYTVDEAIANYTCSGGLLIANEASRIQQEVTTTLPVTDFSVYPNPSTGTFFIELANTSLEAQTVTVLNLQGQILQEQFLSDTTADQKIQMDLNGQAAGVYLIQVRSKDGISVKRVVLR